PALARGLSMPAVLTLIASTHFVLGAHPLACHPAVTCARESGGPGPYLRSLLPRLAMAGPATGRAGLPRRQPLNRGQADAGSSPSGATSPTPSTTPIPALPRPPP